MEIRAEHDHKFNRRNLWLTLFFVGMALWAGYDLTFNFPAKLKKIEAYKEIKKSTENEDDAKTQWVKLADEKGWDRKPPKDSAGDVQWLTYFNYCLAIGGVIFAVYFVWKFYNTRSSWVGADEAAVKNSFGLTVPFKSIDSVDKKKWAKKGIAYVSYKDESGETKTFVMDDFKYLREPMGQIMKRIEEHLKPEQILNGPSENSVDEPSEGEPDENSSELENPSESRS